MSANEDGRGVLRKRDMMKEVVEAAETETRITLVLSDNGVVQTHIEACSGAEPLSVYTRAIAALRAEQQALPGCPVHREPTFRQEIEKLARRAQVDGDRLDRAERYGRVVGNAAVIYRRRANFWLNAASALRSIAEKAKTEERAGASR